MITYENIKDLLNTLTPDEIDKAIDAPGDYILMQSHIFNAGGYATIKSCDYSCKINRDANYNGWIFCDKDDFIRLRDEVS